MTKISQYSTDVNITGNDKWIGSDAQNFLITKNFTPNNLASFFNGNNVIDIGTSIRYMYQTLNPGEAREQGTISFETEIGPQVNFSAITTFLIAKNTLKGNTVTQYLDFLVDSKVLLSRANNINIFGYYKITSIEPWIPNTNFFVVTVDFLDGNGFIYEDLDYLVSLVDKVQDVPPTVWGSITGDIEDQTDLIDYIASQVTTPTLQEVTDEGNTTTNSIVITNINNDETIEISNQSIIISRTFDSESITLGSTSISTQNSDNSLSATLEPQNLMFSKNGFNTFLKITDDLSNSRNYELPDASGTIALTTDITTPTWQETLDVDFGVSNIVTTPFYYDDGVIKNSNDVFGIKTEQLTGDLLATSVMPGQIGVVDQDSGKSVFIDYDYGIKFYKVISSVAKNIYIKADNVTNNDVIFQLPNKATGSYTLATLTDIPSSVTSVSATSPITSSGGTTPDISTSMNTNKLIGRSTAGTGVMEEITVGTGLSLSGGTLNATAQTVGFEQNFLLMGA